MKRNISSVSIFVVLAASVMFMVVPTASAGSNPIEHGIQGTYAVAGGGTGLLAFCGFDEYQIPEGATPGYGPYWILSVVVEGILTLNHDGTGTRNDTAFVQTQPNPLLGPPYPQMMIQPWIGEQTLNSTITYTANKDGTIIIATDGPTIGEWKSGPLKDTGPMYNAPASWRCRVTPDQKVLTCVRILTAGDGPEGLCSTGEGSKIINNDFFVAVWQH